MVGGYFSLPFLHDGRLSCCSAARATTTTKKLNWQLDWMGLDGSNGGDFFIQKYGGGGAVVSCLFHGGNSFEGSTYHTLQVLFPPELG